MTSLSLTKRAIQGIQIKWEVLKNSYAFIFFLQILCQVFIIEDHVGNYDTWLSLEERNLKPFIWVSTSQSALPKRNAKRHLKLTKKFFTISPFLKIMVLFVNFWPHTVDTPTEGSSVCSTRLSSHVIKYYCYYNIKVDWNVLTRIHYKTSTTVF